MNPPKPRILAIDDTPINLLTLGAALAQEFDLQIATSGEEGIALARQSPPDLILLDVMMPGLNGYETCAQLKADSFLQHVPVVFVTALHDINAEIKGLALGAVDYITKPIEVATARQRIRNLIMHEQLRLLTLRQHAQLETANQRFQDLLAAASEFSIILTDPQGRVEMVNQGTERMLGYTAAEMVAQMTPADFHLPEEVAQRADELSQALGHAVSGFEVFVSVPGQHGQESREWTYVRKDGSQFPVLLVVTAVRSPAGQISGYLGIAQDITQRKHADAQLQLAASVFTHAREGIMITDSAGIIVDVNETFSRITGYSRQEVLGQNPRILKSGRQSEQDYAAMWHSLHEKGRWYGEVWNRRKNGAVYAEMLSISAVRAASGRTQHYVALFSDITAQKEHQQQLEHIAHYDALTQLPNRMLLTDRLAQALIRCQRQKQSVAVVFLDLDSFKAVNDTHGHAVGDELLITVSKRLKDALREGDTLARVGGDEFVAVLAGLEQSDDFKPVVTRMLLAAADPVTVGDAVLHVSASMGVTIYPHDESDADLLMRHADQAMYSAKHGGKNRYQLFDVRQDTAHASQHHGIASIRRALVGGEFRLYYQPKVSLRSGRVSGAEALIRWQHPQLGLLPPAAFLPIIEDHPISVEVGEWVIRTVLDQMSAWQSQGLSLPLSINIGARQLQQQGFSGQLGQLLRHHPQLPTHHLQIEVLETSALQDMVTVSTVMADCRDLGVGFALDDFGTGYSSLTYLKRLPVQTLKIDQSFVRDMLLDVGDLSIVNGVIGLARAFGLEVIAEGVETRAHGELLLSLGCELAQGYGIARPMPAAELPAWVALWHATPCWLA